MEKYICEQCKCEHDGSYGSGRFCSRHCQYIYIGKKVNVNGKHKCNFNVHKNGIQKHGHATAPYGTWKCQKCNLIFRTRRTLADHNHTVHPIQKGSSWNKGLTKQTDFRIAQYVKTCKMRNHYSLACKGKKLSLNHRKRISASMKVFFSKHPDRVPYVLNHSSKESYPEKFFKAVFINENFPKFMQEKYVGGYFLDFAFEDLKAYIEIDGEQHYVDKKIVQHDKVRLEALNRLGWKCLCRIRWSKFQRLTDKQRHQFIIGVKNKLDQI